MKPPSLHFDSRFWREECWCAWELLWCLVSLGHEGYHRAIHLSVVSWHGSEVEYLLRHGVILVIGGSGRGGAPRPSLHPEAARHGAIHAPPIYVVA